MQEMWVQSLDSILSSLGISPREGNGNQLQYSYVGNPMGRSLADYSPWGHKRVGHDLATKQQHFG